MISIYRSNIIDALEALSDRAYQEIAWFENDQGLCYSFYENTMDLFYGSVLDEALKAGEVVFGKAADDTLRDLEVAVDKINERDYSADELLDLPQMQSIREQAAKALFLVQTSTGEGSTVMMLEPGMPPA